MWGGAATAIVSLYTAAIFILGINIRPVWAYELEQFNIEQKEMALDFIIYDKRDLRDQLYKNLDRQRDYRENGRPVPDFLLEQEMEIKNEMEDLKVEERDLRQIIIELKK